MIEMIQIDYKISDDGIYELIVGGEVDASSSILLETALNEAMSGHQKIIIDLSGLEYISSAGLGVFMSIIQQLNEDSIELVLFGMQEKVKEVFDILGLAQLINIRDNKEEALEAIK